MKRYVLAVAHVQGQFACGRQGVGYDHATLFGDGPRDRQSEEAWFARAREQGQSGQIKVQIPKGLIAAWRAAAQGEGRGR